MSQVMLPKMILSALSLFPVLAFSAPSPASHQIILSPEIYNSHGISKALFDDFNDLAKIVDITNCLQTSEGISYPFECNSFCKEFPELKLLKQWNTADDLGDSYGFIAISHQKGKERIVIAFAGTYSLGNAIIDLSATPENYVLLSSGIGGALENCPGCKVHGDFHKEWLKTGELIGATVGELVTQYILAEENPYQLVLVGSKLGGAVATLAAVDFEARGWNPQLTTFGQPKVGNEAFTDYLTGKFTPSTYRRVTHVSDPVPLFPLQGLGFSHYEHEYFISKEFAPYTTTDVQICSADSTCPTHVDIGDSLDLDWGVGDYFHHTDTCIRQPTSLFSFSTSFFIIGLEDLGLEKRSNIDPEFYTILETIEEELEVEDENPTTNFEKSQSLWNQNTKQKRDIDVDSDTKLVKPIPNSKFAKTFAMVEPPLRETPPEYEDEELYYAMKGFDKAQGMWVKPQKAPATEMRKRNTIDSDTKFVKPIPDSKFKKTFAMIEPPAPEPEEEVYVPEYEDEDIYNSMNGFKAAQSMWIKPKKESEKAKRDICGDLKNRDIPSTGAGDALVGEQGQIKNSPHTTEKVPADQSTKITNEELLLDEIIKVIVGTPVSRDAPETEDTPKLGKAVGPKKSPQGSFAEIEVSPFGDAPEPQGAPEVKGTQSEAEEEGFDYLENRGLDRALKFFHAPKEVLNAQLAANDEAAAYEAHQKAQKNPSGSPDAAPGEVNPDEDYVKKEGSVLILNGRPLEVDGRPVRNSIHKRNNGHGPGIGLNRGGGPKRGGLRRGGGGGDKVTELSSSSPPTTKSNSVVGVVENESPNSFGEEAVNVQKGGNFVLMNGKRMPANFAQKSVSTKPMKRSYIPEEAKERLQIPEELVFGPEQFSRVPEEGFSTPGQHTHKPKKNPRKSRGKENVSEEYASSTGGDFHRSENFRDSRERFPNSKGYLPTSDQGFLRPEESFHQPEDHSRYYQRYEDSDSVYDYDISTAEDVFRESPYLHEPGNHFAPHEHHHQPEKNFYPTEDRLAVPEQYYHEPEENFRHPENHFHHPEGHFRHPEDRSAASEQHFYQPDEKLHLSSDNFNIPEHHFRQPEDHFYNIPQGNSHFERELYGQPHTPRQHFYPAEGQGLTHEQLGLPQEMLYFSGEQGFGVSGEHFPTLGQNAHTEGCEHIPGQWEMWEIQESHTGPFSRTWTGLSESSKGYNSEFPSETDKELEKYLHNHPHDVQT